MRPPKDRLEIVITDHGLDRDWQLRDLQATLHPYLVDRPGLFDRPRAPESLCQSGLSVLVSGGTFVDDPLGQVRDLDAQLIEALEGTRASGLLDA
jgi:hypothetical protein